MDNLGQLSLTQQEVNLVRSLLGQLPSLQQSTGVNSAGVSLQAQSDNNSPALEPSLTQHPALSNLSQPMTASHTLPIAPYQSISTRANGHPAVLASASSLLEAQPSSSQFQGMRSLGAGVARQVANQQRRASAMATLPGRQSIPTRQARRGRGTAITPPSMILAQAPATLDSTLVTNSNGDTISIKVKIKVYPPTENNTQEEILLYRNYVDSFNTFLENHYLLLEYDLSPSYTVATLIARITEHLKTCPLSFEFTTRFPAGVIRHEALPIKLLALVNRGRMRPTTSQIYLQQIAIPGTTTIIELFRNRNYYAHPRLCLEGDRFVLHFVISQYPVTVNLPTGDGTRTSRHTCLSLRLRHQFPNDGHNPQGNDAVDEYDSSGGESDGMEPNVEEEDDEDETMAELVVSGTGRVPRSMGRQERPSQSTPHILLPEHPAIALPAQIWATVWQAPAIDNAVRNLSSVEDVSEYVYSQGNQDRSSNQKFCIRGKTILDLAANFQKELAAAAACNDYSRILSSDREFIIEHQDGSIRSLGIGIEAEVLYIALTQLRADAGRWFNPRIDDTASIATTHSLTSSVHVSFSRLEGMQVFGAIVALLLAQGIPPIPFSPAVLQWIIHDQNIDALHSALIAEWHPELHSTIKQWLEIGPTDPIGRFQSHFLTWHDKQLGAYLDRNETSHRSIAAEMLYRAVLGSEPAHHPEIQAFVKGFKLSCPNGFDFIHVLKSFEGGAELFISMVWTSQIKAFDDIETSIMYKLPPTPLARQAFDGFGTPTNLKEIMTRFLRGTGIPCPGLFEQAKGHFSNLIDLERVNDASFRPKMFCWAATGCTSILSDSDSISVQLVSDQDQLYALNSYRPAMLAEGKISFKTCTRQVRIPASYFGFLSQLLFNGSEPKSLEDAIDHWLLTEILNAIGQHSVL